MIDTGSLNSWIINEKVVEKREQNVSYSFVDKLALTMTPQQWFGTGKQNELVMWMALMFSERQ